MVKKQRDAVIVAFDPLLLSRVRRQAERSQGRLQGGVQAYIRTATIKQVQTDELAETIIGVKSSA